MGGKGGGGGKGGSGGGKGGKGGSSSGKGGAASGGKVTTSGSGAKVGSGRTKGGGSRAGKSTSTGSKGGIMKAPGGQGKYISRAGFESNPQGYFHCLHHGGAACGGMGATTRNVGSAGTKGAGTGAGKSSSTGSGGGFMKAPGGQDTYILRADFESDPQGYFHCLHHGGQNQ